MRRLALVGSAAVGVGCSSVDRDPADECVEDSDCQTGSVCSLAQGNICVPEELPPQAVIGFDIQDGDLRIELHGCDPELTRELGGSELRVQKRSGLIDEFQLAAITRRSVVNCGGDECAGVCDEQTLTCSEPTTADLSLTMASRLGLSQLRSTQTYTAPLVDETSTPITFEWPSYEVEPSADPLAHAARVLEMIPTGEATNLSPFRRVLADDAPTEIDAVGLLRCQRGLYGIEGGVATLTDVPVIGATVEFRHAEAIATPSTVYGTAPSCGEDDDCPRGWACNPQGTCGLDLTDVLAGSTISSEELVGGYPPAWVYTYCEETLAPVDPLIRQFTVTVTPPTESGLPTLLYSLPQGFIDPAAENSVRQVEVDGQLCLPDWQPPQPVAFSVVGQPVALTENELGTYACCSTACLPSNEPGVEPTPPPSVDSCSAFERARFETRWFNLEPLEAWAFAGCVATAAYPDGSNGRYRTDVTTCEDSGCSVGLTPGAAEELTRTYTVAVTQPVGSVFRSQRLSVQITPDTVEIPPIELEPRVLLRGQINCATEDNCVATNAVVWAERLRVDTDDPDLPGPFFFEARADATGNFVVPVDPGVYVITALPEVGQPGGPSRFEVMDLRDGSSAIELVDGVPNASLSEPLQLDDGILVRVSFTGFEVATTGVTPIDVGSWTAQDDFPGAYDLNDPLTCYSDAPASEARGCAIRRLRPTDAPISLLISNLIQFTARSRGDSSCE